MIQMKDMINLFPKIPLYYNNTSKHAQEKCLNADFLTAGRLFQKKCLVYSQWTSGAGIIKGSRIWYEVWEKSTNMSI